jgi:hypothetical protein
MPRTVGKLVARLLRLVGLAGCLAGWQVTRGGERARRHTVAALLSALATPFAAAADVRAIEVTLNDGVYAVNSEMYFAAPIEAVFDVLADYDDFERISSIFKQSHYLERERNGNGLVYTLVGDCILFFCKDIERTETLELQAPTQITTRIVAAQSDLRSGLSRWALASEGEGTRVRYTMQMEPDFWIPPVIGPFFVKRFLKSGSDRAAQRVEYYARKSMGLEADLTGVGLVPGYE